MPLIVGQSLQSDRRAVLSEKNRGYRGRMKTCAPRSTSSRRETKMLNQPTLEKLEAMRLHGVAQAWREMAKSEQTAELSFEERMALLVNRKFSWREN
ncbi:MAG: ATP-binding protein [Acidobacteriota bacterium]|nr:ATP-binding protein [Acidobacteriota bacterium]